MAQQGESGRNGGESDRRAQRLAAALRENLRRRKAQVRARTQHKDSEDSARSERPPRLPEDKPG